MIRTIAPLHTSACRWLGLALALAILPACPPPPTVVNTPGGPKDKGGSTPPAGADYMFSVDKLAIRKTRSRNNDSDYVYMTVKVSGQEPITKFRFLGDLSSGDGDGKMHPVNLSVGPIHIDDPSARVGFYFLAYNLGNSKDPTAAQRGTVAAMETIARSDEQRPMRKADSGPDTDSPWYKPIVNAIVDAIKKLPDILLADCDGPVARKKYQWQGSELLALTSGATGQTVQTWTLHPDINHTPPIESDLLQDEEVETRTGCGANSDYSVAWSVQRTSP